MTDLTTKYLGFELKNPIVAAASPLSKEIDTAKQLADAGVSAIVMYSLFEEQVIHESLELNHFLVKGTESFAEALSYFPDLGTYNIGVEKYLKHIGQLKKAVDIPVIASLNGVATGGWVDTAKRIQDAGADALELNVYFIGPDLDLTSDELEESYVELVSDVKEQIDIPLSVKLSPFFTSTSNMAFRLVEAGADGLVLFNRFVQPDLDIENLAVNSTLALSTSDELRLPLRWVAMLYGRLQTDLALTTGVHTTEDVVKAVMAGANVVQIASEFISGGTDRARELIFGLEGWMKTHNYESLKKMSGALSQQAIAEPAAFERANYMRALNSLDKIV